MTEGPSRDHIITDYGADYGAESVAAMTSSPTRGAALMAKGEILELSNFFKKISATDSKCQAYHERGWLTGNVISSVPEVDVPTVRAPPPSALSHIWLMDWDFYLASFW
jgi:hypothetical protein